MFNSRNIKEKPGEILFQDRCRTVELAVAFRRIHCYNCELTAIYKYRVQHLRKAPEPVPENADSTKETPTFCEGDLERWRDIPRFAEIPETVKCKRCGEVLGVYTECIY